MPEPNKASGMGCTFTRIVLAGSATQKSAMGSESEAIATMGTKAARRNRMQVQLEVVDCVNPLIFLIWKSRYRKQAR